MAKLPSVDWLGWTAICLGLAVAFLSASAVRARVQYELDGTRHAVWVELRLLFGLWRRHWRVPEGRGRASVGHPVRFGRRAQSGMVPAADPHTARPKAGRSPAWTGIDHMRGRVRLLALRLDVRLGTGDAALTAVAVGLTHALVGTGLALLSTYFKTDGLEPAVRVQPDYAGERLQASGDCIAATRLGHLMVAVVMAWWVGQSPPRRRSA